MSFENTIEINPIKVTMDVCNTSVQHAIPNRSKEHPSTGLITINAPFKLV